MIHAVNRARIAHATAATLLALCGLAHASDTTINAQVRFAHRYDGALLPAKGLLVEFWDYDSLSLNDYLGSVSADQNGVATLVTSETDGLFDYYLEVFNIVHARVPGVAYVRSNTSALPYAYRSPGVADSYVQVLIGSNSNITLAAPDNSTYWGSSFGILQPVGYTHKYFTETFGLTLPELAIKHYNNPDDDRGSFFQPGANPFIRIDKGAWGSWDVIGHEYGHYIANRYGMDANPGGDHLVRGDNIPNNATQAQKLDATGLAWNEGLVTFLYQMAVQEGGMRTAWGENGVAWRDYNTWHTDFNALGSVATTNEVNFEYDLESISYHTWEVGANGVNSLGQHLTAEESRGKGEGNELSVQRVLWDLYDGTGEAHTGNPYTGFRRPGRSDKVALGAEATWRHVLRGTGDLAQPGNQHFVEAWDDLTAYMGTNAGKAAAGLPAGATKYQAVSIVGEIMEEHEMTAYPTFGSTVITNPTVIDTGTPELTWEEQANGRADLFRLLVFKTDWTISYDSGNINDTSPDTATAQSHTIPDASVLADGTYYWLVLTNPDIRQAAALRDNVLADGTRNLTDIFRYYWSGANAFTVSVIPTPGSFLLFAVGLALASQRRRG